MTLKNLSKEELELMTYGEITDIILSEKGEKMKIVDVFRKICEVLEMSDQEFESKIADFFELISTDKLFIILDGGYCDLRKRHTPEVIIEEDEEDETEKVEDIEDIIPEEIPEDDDIFYDTASDEDDVDDTDDDLTDFLVVDEEEEPSI